MFYDRLYGLSVWSNNSELCHIATVRIVNNLLLARNTIIFFGENFPENLGAKKKLDFSDGKITSCLEKDVKNSSLDAIPLSLGDSNRSNELARHESSDHSKRSKCKNERWTEKKKNKWHSFLKNRLWNGF